MNFFKKILIVEDNEEILFTTKMFLELEGYEVWSAENGKAALEVIAQYGIPNLILLDMKMPVMDGWQFSKEFTKRYDGLSPIMVMTAAADSEKRAQEIGAISWVGKPFHFDELLAKIKKFEK